MDKLKVRPVVSAIGSYNYHLADYLSKEMATNISHKYTTKDTFSFVNDLSRIKSEGTFLISYDLTSLFTNTPLDESLDIAGSIILEKEPNLKTYGQIDGVPMGSPVEPVLANLFMGHHEAKWIADYNQAKPTFYKGFMYDILCILGNQNEATEFLNYLNKCHPNIKFNDENCF